MTIGIIELNNRRAALLTERAIKTLKEQRKQTRAVMQRFEGASDLSQDEETTYAHLTLSMVILNALSDQLMKAHFLPKSWDVFTLGSDFDKHLTPLLRKNAKGELWVEYFDFPSPKDALLLLAGSAARSIPEQAPVMPQRPPRSGRTARPKAEAPSGEASVMDLIRMRMPSMSQARYTPKRS